MSKIHAAFDTKIKLCLTGITIACLLLTSRLFYLQISLGDTFYTQSKKNFTRYEQILSLRGNILDSSGTILATNRPVTDLYWQGTGSRKITEHQQELLKKLTDILTVPINETFPDLLHTERYLKKMVLFPDLSFEQLSKIAELFSDEKNIILKTHFKRFYPYDCLASHLLGYLGHINDGCAGKTGVEKLFEETLRGKDGSLMRIINSIGSHLAEYEIEHTLQGQHITTTLDLGIQQVAEKIFPEGYEGCLIVMDPQTGGIKALVSRPGFDPNIFTAPLNQETWDSLQINKPFLNRSCNSCYPIGSIFKLVTMSAALETGIIEQHSAWDCRGYSTFVGRKYHCLRKEGHGLVTTKHALAHSCNIPFFEIGKKIDIDTLAHYAGIFGLGNPTLIQLPESTGLVPSRSWKKRVKKERWWAGETLSATIGQSFYLATPLQVARMIASIQTGYLITPRILETSPIVQNPLPLRAETRHFLQKAMHAVVTKGTGIRLDRFHERGFHLEIKTSTAQVCALDDSKTDKEFLAHAWLAGNFTYKENSPLTLVIVIEHAGPIGLPARTAYQFFKEFKAVMDTRVKEEKSIIA